MTKFFKLVYPPYPLKTTAINNLIRKYSFMRSYLNIIPFIFTLYNAHFSIFHTESLVKMSNSLWFSRIFTLQSFSWFCFNFFDCFLGVLDKRLLREWEIFFITIEFENFQNFNFSVSHFLNLFILKLQQTHSYIH